MLAGRALAFVRGPRVRAAAGRARYGLDVLRHRLVLSYEALSDNITATFA